MFVEEDTLLLFDAKRFSRKYAMIYTAILAFVLITPLVFYIRLLLQIDEAKVNMALKEQSKKIISSMQLYDNSEGVYHFPRYREYQCALYGVGFSEIFSTLEFDPSSLQDGFHIDGDFHYLVYPLRHGYYFSAEYLVVATEHTAYSIYMMATLVMTSIVILLFIFSFLLLKNFSAPFEQLNTQLDNFIKDSMHEINTPLTIININADLFASLHGENKYLWRIKAASKTLATVYNDMDYLIKQGRVEHSKKPINLNEFIQNRVDYFQEIANLKNISIHTNLSYGGEYLFSKTKLQRVVDNTLSNAIKYSTDNTDIFVVLVPLNESILFSVQDQGVGIEDIEKIFSRYYRENIAKGGFGIGLNIVKQIVDEEGIKIEVDSKLNKGTIFKYYFKNLP